MHIYIIFTRLITKAFQMGGYRSDLGFFWGHMFKNQSIGACVKSKGLLLPILRPHSVC
jgi:hypothetical protein